MATMPGQPPDSTNAGTPQAGGSLSGELTRQYAIKRLQQQQQQFGAAKGGRLTPPPGETKLGRF